MTAFFVPDLDQEGERAEDVYAAIRSRTRAATGYEPRERRIFSLAFRHEGQDLEAEVGRPDPIFARTVLAILDLGRARPYVIHCGGEGAAAAQILARRPVYSVTEFEP